MKKYIIRAIAAIVAVIPFCGMLMECDGMLAQVALTLGSGLAFFGCAKIYESTEKTK